MPTYNFEVYTSLVRPLPDYAELDPYDIAVVKPQDIDISRINNGQWLINLKNVSPNDKHPEDKIVHTLCYDHSLIRWYRRPFKYLAYTGKYYAVTTFDFSMDRSMKFPQILSAVYHNRWSGVFMQAHGRLCIPTVGWVGPDTYDICFSGLRDGGIFLISSLGANNLISTPDFLAGYHALRARFPFTKIICVGSPIAGMDQDICYVKYKDSFGSWDKNGYFWQRKLFNWDMSPAIGGEA